MKLLANPKSICKKRVRVRVRMRRAGPNSSTSDASKTATTSPGPTTSPSPKFCITGHRRAMAIAAVAAAAWPSSTVAMARKLPTCALKSFISASYSSSPPPSPSSAARKLVLYSKPGCCLCDGLKEKLQAAFLISGPDSLRDVDLQV